MCQDTILDAWSTSMNKLPNIPALWERTVYQERKMMRNKDTKYVKQLVGKQWSQEKKRCYLFIFFLCFSSSSSIQHIHNYFLLITMSSVFPFLLLVWQLLETSFILYHTNDFMNWIMLKCLVLFSGTFLKFSFQYLHQVGRKDIMTPILQMKRLRLKETSPGLVSWLFLSNLL